MVKFKYYLLFTLISGLVGVGLEIAQMIFFQNSISWNGLINNVVISMIIGTFSQILIYCFYNKIKKWSYAVNFFVVVVFVSGLLLYDVFVSKNPFHPFYWLMLLCVTEALSAVCVGLFVRKIELYNRKLAAKIDSITENVQKD